MRHPTSEKLEIIRRVEASHLPVKQTLVMISIPSSTYYDWYARWVEGGIDALADHSPLPGADRNRIPDGVREAFVEFALDHEALTPRERAVKYTDEKRYFSSESSAYRLLKAIDLITAPAHVVISAAPFSADCFAIACRANCPISRRRRSIAYAMLDIGRLGFCPGNTNLDTELFCKLDTISKARGDNGTLCSFPAFMRGAGTVHTRALKSISLHMASRTSPDREAVKMRNSKALADNPSML